MSGVKLRPWGGNPGPGTWKSAAIPPGSNGPALAAGEPFA